MRVQQWTNLANIADDKYGILSNGAGNLEEYFRKIFLFVDGNEYREFGRVERGKMLLVNVSASSNCKNIIDVPSSFSYCTSSNSTLTTMNVYTFDVEFEGKINDLDSTVCLLNSAIGNSSVNDFDRNQSFIMETPLYSVDEIQRETMSLVNMSPTSSSLPSPKFYTLEQQYAMESDMYNIFNIDTTMLFYLRELYDEHTRIYVYDKASYVTMVPRLYEELENLRYDNSSNLINPTEISSELILTKLNAMSNGLAYIYDSSHGSGIQQTNLTDIMLRKYRPQNTIPSRFEVIKSNIARLANEIESVHGNIRIYYVPFVHGDKISIKFRDYAPDNQPIGISRELKNSFINGGNVDDLNTINNEVSQFYNDLRDE